MKLLLNKISQFFSELYFRGLLWWDARKKHAIDISMPRVTYTRLVTHEAYFQGISKIRSKVHELTKAKTKEEYERVLAELTELQDYAIKSDDPEYIRFIGNLKKAYVKPEKDVRNDADKVRMIDNRIKHYEQLQQDKLKRQELRKARKNAKPE